MEPLVAVRVVAVRVTDHVKVVVGGLVVLAGNLAVEESVELGAEEGGTHIRQTFSTAGVGGGDPRSTHLFGDRLVEDGPPLENGAGPPVKREDVKKDAGRLARADEGCGVVVRVEHNERGRAQET